MQARRSKVIPTSAPGVRFQSHADGNSLTIEADPLAGPEAEQVRFSLHEARLSVTEKNAEIRANPDLDQRRRVQLSHRNAITFEDGVHRVRGRDAIAAVVDAIADPAAESPARAALKPTAERIREIYKIRAISNPESASIGV